MVILWLLRTTAACRKCLDKNFLIACACECGQIRFKRNRLGKIRKFVTGHTLRGEKAFPYKGGFTIDKDGYRRLHCPEHPNACNGYVLEHRLVMEKYLDRLLLDEEIVHHKDENKLNNKLENLELTYRSPHISYHNTGKIIGHKDLSDFNIRYTRTLFRWQFGQPFLRNIYKT
jgi:hypothetical protein